MRGATVRFYPYCPHPPYLVPCPHSACLVSCTPIFLPPPPQLTVTICFCLSVALRGVTVRFYPYSLGFVALTVADVVITCILLVGVSFILGWVPVGETRAAGRNIAALLQQQGLPEDLDGPTELLPLVDYYQAYGVGDYDSGAAPQGGGGGGSAAAAAAAAAAALQRRRGSSGGGGSEGSLSRPDVP